MLVEMIGREGCTRCEEIKPVIENYCKDHEIRFVYRDQKSLLKEEIESLVKSKLSLLPIFIITRENEKTYLSGEDIYIELKLED